MIAGVTRRPRYYRRDGTPYEEPNAWLQWANDSEDWNNRVVKQNRLWWGARVSTVWLGLDHNFFEDSAPLIFESMLFSPSGESMAMERYSTEALARRGHEQLRRKWSNPFRVAGVFLSRIFKGG